MVRKKMHFCLFLFFMSKCILLFDCSRTAYKQSLFRPSSSCHGDTYGRVFLFCFTFSDIQKDNTTISYSHILNNECKTYDLFALLLEISTAFRNQKFHYIHFDSRLQLSQLFKNRNQTVVYYPNQFQLWSFIFHI